jgi:hypothetical protein
VVELDKDGKQNSLRLGDPLTQGDRDFQDYAGTELIGKTDPRGIGNCPRPYFVDTDGQYTTPVYSWGGHSFCTILTQ